MTERQAFYYVLLNYLKLYDIKILRAKNDGFILLHNLRDTFFLRNIFRANVNFCT